MKNILLACLLLTGSAALAGDDSASIVFFYPEKSEVKVVSTGTAAGIDSLGSKSSVRACYIGKATSVSDLLFGMIENAKVSGPDGSVLYKYDPTSISIETYGGDGHVPARIRFTGIVIRNNTTYDVSLVIPKCESLAGS